jgi:hypothetical protein
MSIFTKRLDQLLQRIKCSCLFFCKVCLVLTIVISSFVTFEQPAGAVKAEHCESIAEALIKDTFSSSSDPSKKIDTKSKRIYEQS